MGRRKLTYKFVKEQFEKEGITLLSKEYKNSKTKLKYRCPVGHTHSITWNDWYNGYRCAYCAGLAKPTIGFVRDSFNKEGYVLLSDTYINSKTKLYYICPKGHEGSIIWNSWRNGHRCPICSGNVLLTIDYIKSSFEKEGYTLLRKEYICSNDKLDYICPIGHIHTTTWSNWYIGSRCPTCSVINRSGENHYNWQGGKSFEEYCAIWKDKEFRLDIMGRDAYTCLNPYCDSNNPDDLTIHHIDYDKKNCHPKNLITVCRSCNSRANKDRKWHKAWYQAIIFRRYNYE